MAYFKPSEIAEKLRISTPTVRKLIADGLLSAVSIGVQKRVDSEELARFIAENKTPSESSEVNADETVSV